MVTPLEQLFPGLVGSGWRVTSPADTDYNCIAWAAGDTRNWWWPSQNVHTEYWPPGVPRVETLDAFRAAFVLLGYVACGDEQREAGFEKVAIFASTQGLPKHAARQLMSGRWTSKLGNGEDIEHGLRNLEGTLYGTIALVLKRPLAAAAATPPPVSSSPASAS